MYNIYNNSPRRPVSAQSPHKLHNNDCMRPGSRRCGGLRLTLWRRQICKDCTSLKFENNNLLHEIYWLKTGVENMLKDKETEVLERISMTMDDLYSENQRLKGKLLTEERIRVWGTSYTYSDKVDFVRERYHISLDENTDLERKISVKEREVWDLKSQLQKKNSALKWFEEDMEKKDKDVMKMRQRILELEFDNCGFRSALSKVTEECRGFSTRCQELTAENHQLEQELRDRGNSMFSYLDESLKRQESQYLSGIRRDAIAAENRRIEDLKKENRRLMQEKWDMELMLRKKESEITETRRNLESKEAELNSVQSSLKRQESQYLSGIRRDAIAAENSRIEDLKKENRHLMQEKGDMEQTLRKKESEITETRRNLESKEAELKSIQSRLHPNMEKEVIKKLKEDVSSKEKEIQRLQERVTTEERKYAQLQNRHFEDNILQRKDNEMRELLRKNQYLSDEMNLLISEKKQIEEDVKKKLDIKRDEIDSLQKRVRQLENRNIQLQKDIDPVSKDEHNVYVRNSNAADEVKILQTELEGKREEIQRLTEICTQDEKEKKEMQEKCSNISYEKNNLLQRNQRQQNELNELHAKIRHLEEYRMKTTDEWKYLKELKDTVVNDNDRFKRDIVTLSEEKDIALARYSDAEKELRQLKLDIKSKGEEIQLLQKQITKKEANNEKVHESLSNMAKENKQLLERIRSLEKVKPNNDDQLLLAKDESKRLQGKIRELHSENSQLRRDIDDISKQKEDALTRLSKVAGAKLTHGNAAITDLSDTDRPTKLAEKFSELYDNAWTDAFEELDNTFHNEEETIKVLLRIFQEAYKFCVQTENNYETRIGQAVFTLANETESRQITNTNVEIQKVLADLRISLSTACCSVIEEMLLSKLPSILKSVDVAACPLTKLFASQCASLSWKMRIRDPPLFVRFEFRCGSTFNSDVLKRYTKTGGYLDFLVWPALYLHESGPVLAKGVAQPKIAP